MKKATTILILLVCSLLSYAQELSVKSFYLSETDLTALTPGTAVNDQNGNTCALIKMETTIDGFTFDVGILGVVESKRVSGEVWIYIPFGARKITISHPDLGVIRDYLFPCTIEKGRTYIMTLNTGAVITGTERAQTRQFLHIELNPQDAILEINGKIKATDNGVYQELLPFGKYQYRVFCQDYHSQEGIVEVSDPDNTQTLNLSLKPAFGHISISTSQQPDIVGATVYIDDKYLGTLPIDNIKLSSGAHRMRIIKEMYEAYNTTFTISDEEHQQMSPTLLSDFAEVTLQTSNTASLYVNGVFKAKHLWSGKLATGSYIIESRQPGHLTHKMTLDISRHDQGKTFNIEAPTPIYGSLAISSIPSKAKIYIDGKHIGETPKYISKQVIGEYNISVEADGYKRQARKVNIAEGKEESISFTLDKITYTPANDNTTKTTDYNIPRVTVNNKIRTYFDTEPEERNFRVGIDLSGDLDAFGGFSIASGLQVRFGSFLNYVNGIVGLKYAYWQSTYVSDDFDIIGFHVYAITMPVLLNINYLPLWDLGFYIGGGYEFNLAYSGTYKSPSLGSWIIQTGWGGPHLDFRVYVRPFPTPYFGGIEYATAGAGLTYYF